MRRNELYLHDIVEAAADIAEFIKDVSEDVFIGDNLVRSAVLQKLIVIGEAASRLSKSFCESHPHVEWGDIVAFRNIAVHAYFSVNWGIVWTTAVKDVPLLQGQISAILAAGHPEPDDDDAT